MGSWFSSPVDNKPVNNGEHQNIIEIKNEFNEKHDTVLIFLIIIVVILSLGVLHLLYSKFVKSMKKKYTAPRPTA